MIPHIHRLAVSFFRSRFRQATALLGLALLLPVQVLMAAEEPEIENIGDPINSPADEFAPSLSSDGRTMVFSSRRGGRYPDIYITEKNENGWSDPRPIGSVNSPYTDEAPFLSPDGQFLFFSSDRDGSTETRVQGRIAVTFDIYYAQRQQNGWSRPVKLPGPVNTGAHERSPAWDEEGKVLYFTRWSFGTIEDAHIVRARYDEGNFVDLERLPPQINAGYQEAGFMPARDRSGFYFASQRPGGVGGWDLYYVSYENEEFGEPENLGVGINSPGNDIYLTLWDENLYFCSNREGGRGNYDIYSIPFPEAALSFEVRDKADESVIPEAQISISHGDQSVNGESDDSGTFRITLPMEGKLRIQVAKPGYLPFEEEISIAELNEIRDSGQSPVLHLERPRTDSTFTMRSIHFAPNSADIRETSHSSLDRLVQYLDENSEIKLEIIGHTDLHGTAEYNQGLSERRARAVQDYLTAKGISSNRLQTRGMGFSQPIVARRGPPHDQENRRTEFRVLN